MDDTKLDLAKQMGANYAFNIKTENALARVKEVTGGHGCDVYVEAVSILLAFVAHLAESIDRNRLDTHLLSHKD